MSSALEELLGEGAACCASPYDLPAVRWLMGDDLHPGGDALTRRLAELAGVTEDTRVLDVASGRGRSARLLADELGAEVTGVELSPESVREAQALADAGGLAGRARFVQGEAGALPVPDGEFDVVVCECSLCLFPAKPRALAEMRRVLRPGGTLAVADMTAEPGALPAGLDGLAGQIACLADALPGGGYRALIGEAGFELVASEPHRDALAALAERVEHRLRAARILDRRKQFAAALGEALELVRSGRGAIERGELGYELFVGRLATA